jgi:hypothetical protein
MILTAEGVKQVDISGIIQSLNGTVSFRQTVRTGLFGVSKHAVRFANPETS